MRFWITFLGIVLVAFASIGCSREQSNSEVQKLRAENEALKNKSELEKLRAENEALKNKSELEKLRAENEALKNKVSPVQQPQPQPSGPKKDKQGPDDPPPSEPPLGSPDSNELEATTVRDADIALINNADMSIFHKAFNYDWQDDEQKYVPLQKPMDTSTIRTIPAFVARFNKRPQAQRKRLEKALAAKLEQLNATPTVGNRRVRQAFMNVQEAVAGLIDLPGAGPPPTTLIPPKQ